MLNYEEYTIPEYVRDYKDTDITVDKLHLKRVITSPDGNVIIPSDNILDKYSGELDKLKVLYTMNESEKKTLLYNPKALSYKLYGTTELWFMLLHANQMHSASEFSKETLYIYNESIIPYIVEILNLENEFIATNRTEVANDLLHE